MTENDSEIIQSNVTKLRFSRVTPIDSLILSIGSVRNMNSYVNEQLKEKNISSPNKKTDDQLSDCLSEAMLLRYDPYSEDTKSKYAKIWGEVNSLCSTIISIGNKHNVWEQKMEAS